jgi:hypothetical protein
MKKYTFVKKIAAALGVFVLVMAAYFLIARPYQLRWGATDEEVNRPMPGDELDAHPTFLATRAITINAAPKDIWPWLLQMGYSHAGFYGYDILENIGSPRGMRSATTIVPELQNFKVGDAVPLSAAGGLVFYAIEPERYLIWSDAASQGSFNWALYPIDAGHTRLVSRILWTHHWQQAGPLAFDIFTEFTDHLAVRKILEGMKGRVEGHIEPMAVGTTEFFIYLASAIIFLIALILILIRPLTWRGARLGLAAGVAWLLTWYAPVPIWFGVILELAILWGLFARVSAQPVNAGER